MPERLISVSSGHFFNGCNYLINNEMALAYRKFKDEAARARAERLLTAYSRIPGPDYPAT
jgi:hypothetical protein